MQENDFSFFDRFIFSLQKKKVLKCFLPLSVLFVSFFTLSLSAQTTLQCRQIFSQTKELSEGVFEYNEIQRALDEIRVQKQTQENPHDLHQYLVSYFYREIGDAIRQKILDLVITPLRARYTTLQQKDSTFVWTLLRGALQLAVHLDKSQDKYVPSLEQRAQAFQWNDQLSNNESNVNGIKKGQLVVQWNFVFSSLQGIGLSEAKAESWVRDLKKRIQLIHKNLNKKQINEIKNILSQNNLHKLPIIEALIKIEVSIVESATNQLFKSFSRDAIVNYVVQWLNDYNSLASQRSVSYDFSKLPEFEDFLKERYPQLLQFISQYADNLSQREYNSLQLIHDVMEQLSANKEATPFFRVDGSKVELRLLNIKEGELDTSTKELAELLEAFQQFQNQLPTVDLNSQGQVVGKAADVPLLKDLIPEATPIYREGTDQPVAYELIIPIFEKTLKITYNMEIGSTEISTKSHSDSQFTPHITLLHGAGTTESTSRSFINSFGSFASSFQQAHLTTYDMPFAGLHHSIPGNRIRPYVATVIEAIQNLTRDSDSKNSFWIFGRSMGALNQILIDLIAPSKEHKKVPVIKIATATANPLIIKEQAASVKQQVEDGILENLDPRALAQAYRNLRKTLRLLNDTFSHKPTEKIVFQIRQMSTVYAQSRNDEEYGPLGVPKIWEFKKVYSPYSVVHIIEDPMNGTDYRDPHSPRYKTKEDWQKVFNHLASRHHLLVNRDNMSVKEGEEMFPELPRELLPKQKNQLDEVTLTHYLMADLLIERIPLLDQLIQRIEAKDRLTADQKLVLEELKNQKEHALKVEKWREGFLAEQLEVYRKSVSDYNFAKLDSPEVTTLRPFRSLYEMYLGVRGIGVKLGKGTSGKEQEKPFTLEEMLAVDAQAFYQREEQIRQRYIQSDPLLPVSPLTLNMSYLIPKTRQVSIEGEEGKTKQEKYYETEVKTLEVDDLSHTEYLRLEWVARMNQAKAHFDQQNQELIPQFTKEMEDFFELQP